MKKNDLILIGAILIIVFIVVILIFVNRTDGSRVLISIDGKEIITLDLDKDTTYTIEGVKGEWNTLVIKDGYVYMLDASCPDKLCVHHRRIHFNNETIVCLPNKVVLEIVGGEDDLIDSIVN